MSCNNSTPESLKKRTLNFSSKEVDILINLVEKYRNTIECRKTDRTSNNTKIEAWLKLANEFNSISGEAYRDARILRNKYENIKKRSKQKFADEKLYIRGTGGGPVQPTVVTDIDQKMKDIIGSQMTGLVSEFDGDQEHSVVAGIDVLQGLELGDEVIENELQTESCGSNNVEYVDFSEASTSYSKPKSAVGDWSKYIPSQLRTPTSLPLKTKQRVTSNKENIGKYTTQGQLSNKIVTWADNKAEFVKENLQLLRAEHEFKLRCMKEKHEQDMALAKRDSEEKLQFFAREAELKLQILVLQKQQIENNLK